MIIISDPEMKIKSLLGFKNNFECELDNQQIILKNDESEFKAKMIKLIILLLLGGVGVFLFYKRCIIFSKETKENAQLRKYIWKIVDLRIIK